MFDILPLKSKKDENYYRVERSYGYFNRTVELPAEVDSDKLGASYKRDILKIKLKKAKGFETKKIKIHCLSTKFDFDISRLVEIIIFSSGALPWQKAILQYWVFHQMPL